MVSEVIRAEHGPDRVAATEEGEGAITPDQFGPSATEELGESLRATLTHTYAVRRRVFDSSPTQITVTLHDLCEAIETLAEAVGRQYGVDLLSGLESDETPPGDS